MRAARFALVAALLLVMGALAPARADFKRKREPLPVPKAQISQQQNDIVIQARPRDPAGEGAQKASVPGARMAPLQNRQDKSVLDGFPVKEILKGSMYDQMGLKEGDVITAMNGKRLTKPEDLKLIQETVRKGGKIVIEVDRSGQKHELNFYQLRN